MSCNQPAFDTFVTTRSVTATMCTVASDPSGTWLIVSNEPEEVSLSPLDAPITLYRGSAVLSGGG